MKLRFFLYIYIILLITTQQQSNASQGPLIATGPEQVFRPPMPREGSASVMTHCIFSAEAL